MEFEPIIGLEIHIQLKTRSKMFCGCSAEYEGHEPNTHTCPVCLGLPGALPAINKKAIEQTILAGLSLGCQISKFSKFDRKNYFYPDLPKGYQISQYDKPLSRDGQLKIRLPNGEEKVIRIKRVHLEEDTAKSIHEGSPKTKERYTLIDFNKSGVPLMEIVTEPDISSAEEARLYCEKIRQIMRYLKISEAEMEKGQMRCEVNISLREVKAEKQSSSHSGLDPESFPTRDKNKYLTHTILNQVQDDSPQGKLPSYKVEIKNLNSFRSVEKAIKYEIERQKKILEKGKKVQQETRGWDEVKLRTFSQRTKEEAQDYRYFPEPDLPPMVISDKWIENLKNQLPELPDGKHARFVSMYQLEVGQTNLLIKENSMADFFEEAVLAFAQTRQKGIKAEVKKEEAKKVANWITTDVFRILSDKGMQINQVKLDPADLAEILYLLDQKKITAQIAKQVLEEVFDTDSRPLEVIEVKNLFQVADSGELKKVIEKVIKENPKPVGDFKSGKSQALQFLIGLVMKETKGKANVKKVKNILEERLG